MCYVKGSIIIRGRGVTMLANYLWAVAGTGVHLWHVGSLPGDGQTRWRVSPTSKLAQVHLLLSSQLMGFWHLFLLWARSTYV